MEEKKTRKRPLSIKQSVLTLAIIISLLNLAILCLSVMILISIPQDNKYFGIFLGACILSVLLCPLPLYLLKRFYEQLSSAFLLVRSRLNESSNLKKMSPMKISNTYSELEEMEGEFLGEIGKKQNYILGLEYFIRGLELKYQDNFRRLKESRSEVEYIFSNIRQSIFTINSQLKIEQFYSNYIFSELDSSGSPVGQDSVHFIFSDSDLSREEIEKFEFELNLLFTADQNQWAFSEPGLINEFSKKFSNKGRILKINFSPVFNYNELLEKVIVTLEDKSDYHQLEMDKVRYQRDWKLLLSLLSVKESIFIHFIGESRAGIRKHQALLDQLTAVQSMDQKLTLIHDIEKFFQETLYHSQGIGIGEFFDGIKLTLDELTRVKDTLLTQKTLDLDLLTELFHRMERDLQQYEGFYAKLQKRLHFKRDLAIEKNHVQRLNNLLKQSFKLLRQSHLSERDLLRLEQEKSRTAQLLQSKCLKESIREKQSKVDAVSRSFGVQLHPLDLKGNQRKVPAKLHDPIMEIIDQLVENSLIHGIEPHEERAAKNKPTIGQVTIQFDETPQSYLLKVTDDGRAIDPSCVAEYEDMHPKDANNKIVKSILTAGYLTVKGRGGVGLSYINLLCKDMNGQMKIQWIAEQQFTVQIEFDKVLANYSTQTKLIDIRSYIENLSKNFSFRSAPNVKLKVPNNPHCLVEPISLLRIFGHLFILLEAHFNLPVSIILDFISGKRHIDSLEIMRVTIEPTDPFHRTSEWEELLQRAMANIASKVEAMQASVRITSSRQLEVFIPSNTPIDASKFHVTIYMPPDSKRHRKMLDDYFSSQFPLWDITFEPIANIEKYKVGEKNSCALILSRGALKYDHLKIPKANFLGSVIFSILKEAVPEELVEEGSLDNDCTYVLDSDCLDIELYQAIESLIRQYFFNGMVEKALINSSGEDTLAS